MPESLPNPDDVPECSTLFVHDRELHRLINPKLGWDRFRAAVRNAEHLGFPRVHSVWGGRYWPGVKAWFHKHAGSGEFAADVEDGPENFGRDEHGSTGQRTRSQAGPRSQGRNNPILLDGAPGRAGPDGLPRLVHPAAARR